MYHIIMRQLDKSQKNIEPSFIHIRCPYCFQMFRALKNEFEEDCPDFRCSVCNEKFWIDSKETKSVILAQPSVVKKYKEPISGVGVSTKVCPRCTEEVPMGDQECSYCGVVFIKFIEGVESSFQLRGLWAKVIKNWHDENRHDEFLRTCYKQNELVYGISCYGRILKEDKENKKAQEMIKRMESLTWFFEEEISLPKKNFSTLMHKMKVYLKSYAFDALMLTFAFCFLFYIFI